MTSDQPTILIAGAIFGFPDGYGASARICNYAAALPALGFRTRILVLKASEPSSTRERPGNHFVAGSYGGAEFRYMPGETRAAASRIGRYRQNLRGLVNALRFIVREGRRSGPAGLLLYGTNSVVYCLAMWAACRLCSIPLVGETTEAPHVYARRGLRKTIAVWLWEHLTAKLFDGFVVISRPLEAMVRPHLRRGVDLVVVPVLVDTSLFPAQPTTSDSATVMYSGTLDRVDEIDRVLRIWVNASTQLPGWRLVMVGGGWSDGVSDRARSRAQALGVGDSVEFAGLVPRSELAQVLASSSILVLPRISGLFSTAGLPNKLGEYLASGRPVVTTKVGDISLYLRDGEDAFLVEPDDEVAFAQRIVHLATHPEEAAAIGEKGRAAAQKYFDTVANSRKLAGLFESVWSRRAADA